MLVSDWNEAFPPLVHHGIVGLAPQPLGDYDELVVKAWKDAGSLPKFMFSINYLSFTESASSYIYFGGYENEFVSSENLITWFDITGDGFWSLNCPQVFYGDSNETLGGLGHLILDTGASYISMKEKVIAGIVKSYGKTCEFYNGLYFCECSGTSSFQDIYFGFGEDDGDIQTVRARADNWVIYIPGDEICVLKLAGDSDHVSLGDAFLRDLYVIHDGDNQKLGFVNMYD